MPRIIQMDFKRRRPERFLITWDNEETHVFSPESVLKFQLAPQKEFSDAEYRQMLYEDGIRRAKDQIMKYLGIRPHSRHELANKALRKGFAKEVIAQALIDLEKVGLIDDRQFAAQFIRNELKFRPCGSRLLKEKLFEKGISPRVFQPLLKEAFQQQPEEEMIREIAEKYLHKNRHLPAAKRAEKLVRYLQGKGFGWEQIREVSRQAGVGGEEAED